MNILFIGPTHMDIYKDVLAELEKQGHSVDFTKAPQFNSDPRSFTSYRRISKYLVSEQYFIRKINKYWSRLLNSAPYDKAYDLLFVIDGHGVRKIVFDILRERNPKLKAVNYLFDTTTGVYQFEKNFQYYDKIFSFDSQEVEKYGLTFLPIFWTPIEKRKKEYDFFGMGGFSKERYELFRQIDTVSEKFGYNNLLKLYSREIKHYSLYKMKFAIRRLLGYPDHISPEAYESKYITHEALTPTDFKELITKSRITIDTCAPHQIGMTARYMWALGNGEKIITTNLNAEKEGFGENGQIYVIKKIDGLFSDNSFQSYLNKIFTESAEHKKRMKQYRIDNWVKAIVSI